MGGSVYTDHKSTAGCVCGGGGGQVLLMVRYASFQVQTWTSTEL